MLLFLGLVTGTAIWLLVTTTEGFFGNLLALAIGGWILRDFAAEPYPRIRVFPYYEGRLPDADTYSHGHHLARNWGRLVRLGEASAAPGLSHFGFEDPLYGEEQVWHDPLLGLHSVRQTLRLVRQNPDCVDNVDGVCADLERLERALCLAHRKDLRFSLLVSATLGGNALMWEMRGGWP